MLDTHIMEGRLTADPELRQTKNGTAVCTISIAHDKGYGEKKRTVFPTLVFWRHHAEYLCKYARKGTTIFVTAEYDERKYEKDGISRKVSEFVVQDVRIPYNADIGDRYASTDSGYAGVAVDQAPISEDFTEDDLPF